MEQHIFIQFFIQILFHYYFLIQFFLKSFLLFSFSELPCD